MNNTGHKNRIASDFRQSLLHEKERKKKRQIRNGLYLKSSLIIKAFLKSSLIYLKVEQLNDERLK